MEQYELIATSTFGIEGVVKRELINLGFKILKTENGKVTFLSDPSGIAKANLWLRTADRVLLKVAEFKATSFDELFDKTKAIPWHNFIAKDGKFIINAKSVKSKLYSLTDCQKIVKKAVAENLKGSYKVSWLEETGANYNILVSILKDTVTLTLDTSGAGLHKRGYRVRGVKAPLKETLGATLVLLSYWNKERPLYDVFCGSGTIAIEAAMIGRNIAPGLSRDFDAKHWSFIDSSVWKSETKKAYLAIDHDAKLNIFASDIDEFNILGAIENAEEAGVDDCITFVKKDFRDVEYKEDYGVIISNPPYGERLSKSENIEKLYQDIGKTFKSLETWSVYLLTAFKGFQTAYNKKADRQRKLYNGRIETWYYQYFGPRPPQK